MLRLCLYVLLTGILMMACHQTPSSLEPEATRLTEAIVDSPVAEPNAVRAQVLPFPATPERGPFQLSALNHGFAGQASLSGFRVTLTRCEFEGPITPEDDLFSSRHDIYTGKVNDDTNCVVAASSYRTMDRTSMTFRGLQDNKRYFIGLRAYQAPFIPGEVGTPGEASDFGRDHPYWITPAHNQPGPGTPNRTLDGTATSQGLWPCIAYIDVNENFLPKIINTCDPDDLSETIQIELPLIDAFGGSADGRVLLSQPEGIFLSRPHITTYQNTAGETITSGTVGQTIHIKGYDLHQVHQVTLDGNNALFEPLDEHTLEVKVPAPGAGVSQPQFTIHVASAAGDDYTFSKPFQVNQIIFVKLDATGANDGSSWDDAYTSLSTAVAAAESGDQLWVSQATYTLSSELHIDKTLSIYGGCDGTEISEPCVGTGSAKSIVRRNSGRIMRVTGDNVYLRGLAVQDGYNASDFSGWGQGILILGKHAHLEQMWVRNNDSGSQTSCRGGGIAASSAATGLTISFSSVSNNTCSTFGGGLYAAGDDIKLIASGFTSNTVILSSASGAGVYIDGVSGSHKHLELDRVTVWNNTRSSSSGGNHASGLYTAYRDIIMKSSHITNNNSSSISGYGWRALGSKASVESSFISNTCCGGITPRHIYFPATSTHPLTIGDAVNIDGVEEPPAVWTSLFARP